MKKFSLWFTIALAGMLIIAGTNFVMAGSVTVKVVASDGVTPVPGVAIAYGSGTNAGAAWFPGTPTGAAGTLTTTLASGTYSFRAQYRNGTVYRYSVDCSGPTTDVTFQTSEVQLDLTNSGGEPLSGGTARFGAGAVFTTTAWPGGSTDAAGRTTAELFPGTYSIEMNYNTTAQAKSSVTVAAGTNTFTWNTTTVTLQYSGVLSYGGSAGDSRYFTKPAMDLLPCTVMFNARPESRFALTIPESGPYSKSVIVGILQDGAVNIEGGIFEHCVNLSWIEPVTTTTAGYAVKLIDPPADPNLTVRMKYQSSVQAKIQDITTNSRFAFQLVVNEFTLTPTAGPNGTISPSTPQTVVGSATPTFTFTPAEGYHIESITVDGIPVPVGPNYTFPEVSAGHTIDVQFAINMYTLTVNAVNGTAALNPPTGPYAFGTVVTLTPGANGGFTFAGWTGTDVPATHENDDPLSLTMNADKTITASFAALPGTIGGTVSANGAPLENVTVELHDALGAFLSAASTNASGKYSFANVPSLLDYIVMIVKPLGWAVDPVSRTVTLPAGGTCTVDYELIGIVVCNRARDYGYWKHQFEEHRRNSHGWKETLEALDGYIAAVHAHYDPYFSIFHDLNTRDDWEDLLTMRCNFSMRNKAIKQLAALVMNFVSLKIGQNTIVTKDGRTAGDVLTYVSQLVTDNKPENDKLARTLAMKVNDGDKIGAGIVPEGAILYKGAASLQQIDWAFDVPTEYALSQNYPNPFNPSTTISYALPQPGFVTVKVYDALGREVAALINEFKEPGRYSVAFDASTFPTGMYICSIRAGDYSAVKKMMLLK